MIRPTRRRDRYEAQYRFMGTWRGWAVRYLSVKSRNRLLFVADRLNRMATWIRKVVKARTPPRRKAIPAVPTPIIVDTRQVDIEGAIASAPPVPQGDPEWRGFGT